MFDAWVMVDWSAGRDHGPTPRKDAIWIGQSGAGDDMPPVYMRGRRDAEAWLVARIEAALARGERLCVGFDFAFAYPAGFARQVTGSGDPFALWDWFAERVEDGPKGVSNRFGVGGELNAIFGGVGPFWGNGAKADVPHLPRKGRARTFRWREPKRAVERRATGAFEVWQLAGAGCVGSQVIMGLPTLARLRARFGDRLGVWPWDHDGKDIVLVEIFPSLLADAVRARSAAGDIRDAVQVTLLAGALARAGTEAMFDTGALEGAWEEEGWILGVGHEAALDAAARDVPAVWR